MTERNRTGSDAVRRVMVVDDEPLARQRLASLVNDLEHYQVVAMAGDGHAALELLAREEPEILLLDIRMPGLNGLDLAARLRDMPRPPAILFCTAYDHYAREAFGVRAAGYLLKPVRRADLLQALEDACRLNRLQWAAIEQARARPAVGEGRSHLSIQRRHGIDLIALDEVRAFIAEQKYVTVLHAAGEALIDEPLRALEQEFADRLVRIHRNALVALDAVESLEATDSGHRLRLRGVERPLRVSRRHLSELKRRLRRV